LRSFGHNLRAAADAAIEAAPPGVIEIDDSDWARVARLDSFYKAKAFEYLMPGFMSLPIPRELCQLTERLIASTQKFVDAYVRSSLPNGPAV
jgi:hypothetical protein